MTNFKQKTYDITPTSIKSLIKNMRSEYRSYPKIMKRLKAALTLSIEYPKDLREKKKFILMGTSHFGNLGDQAITIAQIEFLRKNFPDREILEIQINEFETKFYEIHKVVTDKDIIIFPGGGNLGDIYIEEENTRYKTLRYFKNIPSIQFPQSLTFKDQTYSSFNANLSKRIYSKRASNFVIGTRESKSYALSQKIFPKNEILYTPDIVLSLSYKAKDITRDGILFCLRNDSEKILPDNQEKLLINFIEDKYRKVTITDTVVPYSIKITQRDNELNKIWKQFSSSRLVITDRLHGLIFSIVTGTPCIVFDNFNSKIKMTYLDWLISYKNVRFISQDVPFSLENIMTEIEEIIDGDVPPFDSANVYEPLINAINKLSQNK